MTRQESLSILEGTCDNSQSLFFMLGPCAIENETHALKAAEFLKTLSEKLGFVLIYKSSYAKANRISKDSYRGVGLKAGLKILSKVQEQFDVPVVTDVHEAREIIQVAEHVDVLQIPAFLCRQTSLLEAAGKSGKIVNIKKGQFASPNVMEHAAKKVVATGGKHIWLCERGFAFGYGNLVVDFKNFPIMKSYGYPVVFDVTHAVQQPAGLGSSSGGQRQFVADLAISAVAQGIAGMFLEVHEEPERASCDGPNMVRFSQLEELIKYLIDLDTWVKGRPKPQVS